MIRETYSQRLVPTNIVHHAEQGRLFLQRMVGGLRARDPIPALPVCTVGPSGRSAVTVINELRGRLRRATSIDDAITAIKRSEYFEPYLRGHATLIAQIRNALPSDATIVYRHADGEFELESMYSVAHDDPTGPLVTGPWILPATRIRTRDSLQRYVFGLHEFAEPEELLESYVYRTIYADRRLSWHAVVLARDEQFTWVLYVWYSVEDYANIREAVTFVRAGLAQLAVVLGELFEASLQRDRAGLCHADSVHEGLLAFTPEFGSLRRQNFAAEMMLQGLTNPHEIPPRRSSIYLRLRLEHDRRVAANLPSSWTVDGYCHPIDHYPREAAVVPALRVEVETCVHPISGTREQLVKLRELHLPHLPPLESWRLTEHSPTGVATSLKRLGSEYREGGEVRELPDGYFIKATMCVARPVWDIDIIADRIQHYYRVEATDLGRRGLKAVDFETYPMCALLFRDNIIGVLQAI